MSKIEDRLTRLHASRVRALETEAPDAPRVFVADPSDAPVVKKVAEDTPARQAVREQLEIGQRLGKRTSKPKRVTMRREAEFAEPPVRRAPAATSDNLVGERLTDLRVRAEALIAVGGLESATPLLHEMAALSPTHPFPLTQLSEYWRAVGNDRLAELYEGRLAAIAPY